MSAPVTAPRVTRLPWGWLGLGLLALTGGAWLLWRDAAPAAVLKDVLATIRATGPWAYFTAMALVPLPLIWFTVPAGEAFAPQLTLPGVIAAASIAVAVQQALSYAIARYVLRPVVERLIRRRGWNVPCVTPKNALGIALVVRLTPGPPMILGSCLLALAEVPFRLYLVVSWLVALPWICAGVILGHGILEGRLAPALTGFSVLVAAAIAARLLRRSRWLARSAT